MKSRRKIQMICICMAMLALVGCTAGRQADLEPMNVIPLAELDGEGVADWNLDSSEEDNSEVAAEEATEEISEEINEEESTEEEELSVEESLEQNGWARVPENTEFVLGKDMKFRLAEDRLVKGDQSVIFGDVYGTVYRAYVMEPQEGQYYMLLETWDYMQLREDYVLVYQLTENAQYDTLCKRQMEFMDRQTADYPAGHGMYLLAKLLYENPQEHITVVLKEEEERERLWGKLPFLANVTVVSDSIKYPLMNEKTTYYVCKNHTCLTPTNEL